MVILALQRDNFFATFFTLVAEEEYKSFTVCSYPHFVYLVSIIMTIDQARTAALKSKAKAGATKADSNTVFPVMLQRFVEDTSGKSSSMYVTCQAIDAFAQIFSFKSSLFHLRLVVYCSLLKFF